MHFLLAAIAVAGRAGKDEFTDAFVQRKDVQAMQRLVETVDDPEIEAMGFDRIRSRLEVKTKSGKTIEKWADENYRGSPHNPLSDKEVEGKFRDCAKGLLGEDQITALFERVWNIENAASASDVLIDLDWKGTAASQSVA
jgi:2-methylcitrate dehydratase PrpD